MHHHFAPLFVVPTVVALSSLRSLLVQRTCSRQSTALFATFLKSLWNRSEIVFQIVTVNVKIIVKTYSKFLYERDVIGFDF